MRMRIMNRYGGWVWEGWKWGVNTSRYILNRDRGREKEEGKYCRKRCHSILHITYHIIRHHLNIISRIKTETNWLTGFLPSSLPPSCPSSSLPLTSVCGKIESHRETLLSRQEILLVELVTLLCRWETSILTDCPPNSCITINNANYMRRVREGLVEGDGERLIEKSYYLISYRIALYSSGCMHTKTHHAHIYTRTVLLFCPVLTLLRST